VIPAQAQMILQINEENPQSRFIEKAAEILDQGGVILYPTDTVYAYGCDITKKDAIERIYRIREIKRNKPLSFIFSDISMMHEYVRNIPDPAFKIMKRVLPGPYTFIYQASKMIPKVVLTKQKTIGVRIPGNRIPLEIVKCLGRPLLSASVPSPVGGYIVEPEEIEKVYRNQLDLVIDCGKKVSEPSTVIDFSTGRMEVLREGKGPIDF
jgi:tRNA threonylcarbamoyl adenosine modification protein (Sua5/YciO/YrdC/YwlC family)